MLKGLMHYLYVHQTEGNTVDKYLHARSVVLTSNSDFANNNELHNNN